jgi:aminoglycoside phosphotransferase
VSPPRGTGPPLQPTTTTEVSIAAAHAHVDYTLTAHDAVLGLMQPQALLGLTHSLRHLEATMRLLFRLPTDDCPSSDPALDR